MKLKMTGGSTRNIDCTRNKSSFHIVPLLSFSLSDNGREGQPLRDHAAGQELGRYDWYHTRLCKPSRNLILRNGTPLSYVAWKLLRVTKELMKYSSSTWMLHKLLLWCLLDGSTSNMSIAKPIWSSPVQCCLCCPVLITRVVLQRVEKRRGFVALHKKEVLY